jgi:thiol-disulfide isomerase/thioredoxin
MRAATVAALLTLTAASIGALASSTPAEFTHKSPGDWINSPPLTLAGLKGKVVLVDFWAFKCVNCLNSLAWLHSVEQTKGPSGLVVVSVHRPELSEERNGYAVRSAVKRLSIDNPVMLDTNGSYWDALHIQYWPTFCLIGRDGLLYGCVPGEMHVGDQRATQMENAIDALLRASPS